jgi:hypothetical protein
MASSKLELTTARAGWIGRLPVSRSRLLALGVGIACLAVVAIWIGGVRSAGPLPDVGDPFDVAAETRPVRILDDDNAFVLYTNVTRPRLHWPPPFKKPDFEKLTWSQAGEDVRAFVDEHRPALEFWREASARPEALYHQPSQILIDTLLPIVQEVSGLARMAGLEGSRHEEKGEMNQAWTWYRAMLRSSRHVGMHGVIIERLVGARMHELAAERALHWAADPRTDGKLLRQALDDILAADAMTPPLSRALKLDYLMYLHDLRDLRVLVTEIPMPGGRFGWFEQMVKASGAKPQIQRIRLQATNDVERSRRAISLLFANWLAQVDKPASQRAPIAIQKPTVIFAADPTAPPAARAVPPEVLDQAIDHTAFAREVFHPPPDLAAGGDSLLNAPFDPKSVLGRELRHRAVLIVMLAAELFGREQGHPPATAGALLGRYLKQLPEGIKQDDPIPARLD